MDKTPFLGVYENENGEYVDMLSQAVITKSDLKVKRLPFYGVFLDKDGVEHDLAELGGGGGGGSGDVTKLYVDTRDTSILSSANSYTDSAVASRTTKTYVDTQDSVSISSANSYSDNRIADTVVMVNDYTDAKAAATLSTAKTYTEDSIVETSGVIKEYVDEQDAAMLAAAKTYTDNKPSGDVQKTYVDAQDAATLAAAKAYTDSRPSSDVQKSYVDEQDIASVASAKVYTDMMIEAVRSEIPDTSKFEFVNGVEPVIPSTANLNLTSEIGRTYKVPINGVTTIAFSTLNLSENEFKQFEVWLVMGPTAYGVSWPTSLVKIAEFPELTANKTWVFTIRTHDGIKFVGNYAYSI